MTIAETAGAVTISDNYGLTGLADDQTKKIPMVTYIGCGPWNDTSNGDLRGDAKVCLSVVNTSGADAASWSVSIPPKFEQQRDIDRTAIVTSVWIDGVVDDDDGVVVGEIKTVPNIGFDAPRLTMASFDIFGAVSSVNVHGFYFAESQSTTAETLNSIGTFEVTGVHDESSFPVDPDIITLFDANMPCSAYLMKVLACDNANRVGFNTLTQYSFPMTGTGTSP
jgi:hypothetical protein